MDPGPDRGTRFLTPRLLATLALLGVLATLEWASRTVALAQWASDMLQLTLALTAAGACLRTAGRAPTVLPRVFWGLIGLGVLAWAGGEALWILMTHAGAPSGLYAAADFLFIVASAPVLAACGTRPHRPRAGALGLAVDVGLLGMLVFFSYLYFPLANLLVGAVASYQQLSPLLYPIQDLFVLGGLLWLRRGARGSWRQVYDQLSVALVLFYCGGTVSGQAIFAGRYHAGFYDLPWTLSFLWIAFAPRAWRPEEGEERPPVVAEEASEWRQTRQGTVVALLAVVLVPTLHVTTALVSRPGRALGRLQTSLALATSVLVGGLCLLRQRHILGQAEKTQREREERFRALVENSSDALGVVGADGVFHYASASVERVTGYSPAELVGTSALALVHLDDRDQAWDTIKQIVSHPGRWTSGQFRYRHRDGSWRDAEVDAVSRMDEPAIGGVVVNFRDVTERRRAEQELQHSLSLLEATLESTADGILVVDSEGHTASFNQKFLRMWGIPAEAMASRDHEHALGFALEQLKDKDAFLSRVRAVHGQAQAESFDTLQFKDGRVFERYSQPQRLGEKVVGRVWSFRDVTERTRAEEAMSRLVAILEATTDFVGMADLQGRVLYLNRAGRRMVGLAEQQDLSPTRIAQLHPAWAARIVLEEALPAAMGAGVWSGETALVDGQGREIPVLQLVLAHRSPGGEVEFLSTIARDIRQRKQSEEALRRSQTMAALGSLVAGVAHEVRNPLFGISSTLDAFEARFGRQHKQRKYVEVLREQLERLNALMNDLLEYGKPARLEMEEGSLEEVVAKAVAACVPLAERAGVELVNRVAGGLPPLRMEHKRLVQVFRNLVENAVQHSPRGGTVTVGAERVRRDGRTWLDCAVEDTGPGIAEPDLVRLFEPFFTRRHGGTGLGLSIVQRIVEEHGGNITAANRPHGGAVLKVCVPCAVASR